MTINIIWNTFMHEDDDVCGFLYVEVVQAVLGLGPFGVHETVKI
jgi:hypothetical protein